VLNFPPAFADRREAQRLAEAKARSRQKNVNAYHGEVVVTHRKAVTHFWYKAFALPQATRGYDEALIRPMPAS
jgi:hypothetical protein